MQTASGTVKFLATRSGITELKTKLEQIFQQWKFVEIVDVVCNYDLGRRHLKQLNMEIRVNFDTGPVLLWTSKTLATGGNLQPWYSSAMSQVLYFYYALGDLFSKRPT